MFDYATGNPGAAITPGPDQALWFVEGGSIGRMTTTRNETNYPLPGSIGAGGIRVGPDGNLWFHENGGRVGHITPSGAVAEVPGSGYLSGAAFGPDGACRSRSPPTSTGSSVLEAQMRKSWTIQPSPRRCHQTF